MSNFFIFVSFSLIISSQFVQAGLTPVGSTYTNRVSWALPNGSVENFKTTHEIESYSADGTNHFTKVTATYPDQSTFVQPAEASPVTFLNLDEPSLIQYIDDCTLNFPGTGIIENVSVVAGSFKTCKVTIDNSAIDGTIYIRWIGPVPGGLVKSKLILSPESILDIELESFKLL